MATKNTAEKRTRAPQISDETLRLALSALDTEAQEAARNTSTDTAATVERIGKLYAAQQEIEKVLAKRGGAA